MKRIVVALALALLTASASAADNSKPPTGIGHPSIWKVQGKHSTVYLFGSVHLLSPTLAWRDDRIDTVIHDAGTFFFETSLDPGPIKQIVADKGSLPAGQSLRALLPPESQADLDADLASIGLPEANIDTRRPWLATMAMTSLKYVRTGASPYAGVDYVIMNNAQTRGKPIRYLETIDQQIALLAPSDPKVDLEGFEAFLREFKNEGGELGPLTDAWFMGDQVKLNDLLMGQMAQHPIARKAMFDDRNKAWLKTLQGVLDNESGSFLVTVGAGHLLGERGVPALLRRAGYKVEEI